MDRSSRLQYLEAMGIDVWIPRKTEQVETSIEDMPTCEMIVESDNQLASGEDSWAALRNDVPMCRSCMRCQARKKVVLGEGPEDAEWMVVGDMPDENDDKEGRPFVDSSGYLLTEMLRAVGLQREQVYITNALKCSSREESIGTEQLNACFPFLQREIALLKPRIILLMGKEAAQMMLPANQSLAESRGVVHEVNGIKLVLVHHPRALLKSLINKRLAWQDLQIAIKAYQEK